MKLQNFTQEETKHLLTLYAGVALPAVITAYHNGVPSDLISDITLNYASALLKKLDERITNGNSSKQG